MVVTHTLWEWPVHRLLLWVAGIFWTMKMRLIVCTCKCVWSISSECFQCLLNAYFSDIHGALFRVEEFGVFLNFNSDLTLPCEPCDGQLECFFRTHAMLEVFWWRMSKRSQSSQMVIRSTGPIAEGTTTSRQTPKPCWTNTGKWVLRWRTLWAMDTLSACLDLWARGHLSW